jgi:hypothetical protein
MSIAGDMDLNPETGQYRLSAAVPGVEVNDLRRTLGMRPMPFPLGGALRGVLHCTGPLETPVFSGAHVQPCLCPSLDSLRASLPILRFTQSLFAHPSIHSEPLCPSLNSLRASLPTPQFTAVHSRASQARTGVLHCTGPLETPVISGALVQGVPLAHASSLLSFSQARLDGLAIVVPLLTHPSLRSEPLKLV